MGLSQERILSSACLTWLLRWTCLSGTLGGFKNRDRDTSVRTAHCGAGLRWGCCGGKREGWAWPWPCPRWQPVRGLPTTLSPDAGSVGRILDGCPGCMVGGGGGFCLVAGTSQKSWQPNLPSFLTVVTVVWALQTARAQAERALHWVLTNPLPLPSPPHPGGAFPWPGSELPAHPLWPTLSICPTSQARQLAVCQGWAHVSSRPPGEGGERVESPERPAASWAEYG